MLYSPDVSERLRYITSYLFEELWQETLLITSDRERYAQGSGIGINYSASAIREQEVQIYPHTLLSEQGVQEQTLSSGLFQGVPTCFAVPPGSALPFDPLAASFFVLSRYEEYLPYEADGHGRYPAALSWAYRNGALSRPIIWEWLKLLAATIQTKFPQWRPARTAASYQFAPTYDIDISWAFRFRGWRGWARAAIEALRFDGRMWRGRLRSWFDATQDPFFTFPALQKLHQDSGLRPVVFWLVADRSKHDINPRVSLRAFQELIRQVATWSDSGLHPSYMGGQSTAGIQKEKKRLESVLDSTIVKSRQHFLRLSLPDTYRALRKAGIKSDYSMGFAAQAGFRAGTTEPFWWYDLSAEQVTKLRVHPFAVMDVTLKQYLAMQPEEAQNYLRDLQAYCRREGLQFCTLWHNSSFSDLHGWEGWQAVYWSLFSAKP